MYYYINSQTFETPFKFVVYLQHSKMASRSIRYPTPSFTHTPQTNEADPQPPDPSTIQNTHTTVPPSWLRPRDPASTSIARWSFANTYIIKLILELFQWGTKFEIDLREHHVFDTDANMEQYFRRHYSHKRDKEDWFALNLLLYKTIVNIMRHYTAEKQNHTPNSQLQQLNDFFTYFAPRFNTLLEHMRPNKN